MLTTQLLSFASTLLLLSATTVTAAPISVSSHIEILRISGVSEREIEHALNPNHALASVHESTISSRSGLLTLSQQYLLSSLAAPSDPEFSATIDGYSTAKNPSGSSYPASASSGNLAFEDDASDATSLGAFERVKNWMSRKAGDGRDDDMIVTGRMGDIKIRARR